jgi:transposase
MSKLVIAVDIAKDVFELAVARPSGKIIGRKRLTRSQFERFWSTREPGQVAMEACGSAHHWARQLIALGFEVTLLPPKYVRPYRQRNKTDKVDCEAVLEAFRLPRIKPVAVKSPDQQAILALHAHASSGRIPARCASTGCAVCSASSDHCTQRRGWFPQASAPTPRDAPRPPTRPS